MSDCQIANPQAHPTAALYSCMTMKSGSEITITLRPVYQGYVMLADLTRLQAYNLPCCTARMPSVVWSAAIFGIPFAS